MTYSLEMHESFDCPRSAEDVFYYIADFSRIDEWDHTIIEAKKSSPGQIGVGTTFDLVYKNGFKTTSIQYTVNHYEPFKKLIMVGEAESFTAVDTVTLSQTDNGCHVDWHAALEFHGTAAKIVKLVEGRVKKAGAKTIKDLSVALQDNYPAPTATSAQKLADKLVLPAMFGFTKYGYRRGTKHWHPVTANMRGKYVVVTGGTSGLGKQTATELAHRGAEVLIVGRDQNKCEEVVAQIIEQTGNQSVFFEVADLSLIQDVRDLSTRMQRVGKAIDVLVNNAGALFNPRQTTAEGLEISFALLLLSPVILTQELLPLLKKAKNARVINVSSGGMYAKRISVNNLQSDKGEYGGSAAYARCKRGLVIHGEEWAKEWQEHGITVHNMHPGWALTPGVETALPEFADKMNRFLRDSNEGADTIVWLACATEVAKTSGLFWFDRTPHTTHLTAKTRETSAQRKALLEAVGEYVDGAKRVPSV